ncbi:hypothetical protein Gasu2_58110 [Galdieria sulphuraria]|uniref:Exocyst complex component Sec3 PIP2-binding N-terminal domain-containing protein n=1 Tax=Galdieria sulphuraria TaxID=130081 RepID=M2WV32_GALSU|nr:uncharacterized protein Gasu_46470 [Galdieria sulphuraria]EME27825.1 hypothetical protein Gasu_46470 [Galdieria sulphuraria]GJD11684.1 hypothetical protein Gasu2_58110 [Galdieria sulphuraria]|eukprot:XP_005704345.1 hypothetical protein Gasu_46470 [Galdieria sulphuraria]
MPSVPKLPALIVAAQTALPNDEKCIAAVSVYKLEMLPNGPTSTSNGVLSRAKKAGKDKLRCLAVCERVKSKRRRIVKLSDPCLKSLTVIRSWKLDELQKIDGMETGSNSNLRFTMIFGEKLFAFESKYTTDRAKFLWTVIESYSALKGRPPKLENLALTKLEEASRETNNTTQPNTPLTGSQRSVSESDLQHKTTGVSSAEVNSPHDSQQTIESTDSSVWTSSPATADKKKSEKGSTEKATSSVVEETRGVVSPVAGNSNFNLSEEEIADILQLLDNVNLANFDPSMLAEKIQDEARVLEDATISSLITASSNKVGISQSLDLLLAHVKELEDWFNTTDDRLQPIFSEALELHHFLVEMDTLNTNLTNLKSQIEELIDMVFVSKDEENILKSPSLSDDRFIIEQLTPAVRVLSEKLHEQNVINSLSDLRAVFEGKKKLEEIRRFLCKNLQDSLVVKTRNVLNRGALSRRVILGGGLSSDVFRSFSAGLYCMATLDESEWKRFIEKFVQVAKESSVVAREAPETFRSTVNAVDQKDNSVAYMQRQLRTGILAVGNSLCSEFHCIYSLFYDSCVHLDHDTNEVASNIVEQECNHLSEAVVEFIDYCIYYNVRNGSDIDLKGFEWTFYLAAFAELYFLSAVMSSYSDFASLQRSLEVNANVKEETADQQTSGIQGSLVTDTEIEDLERPLNLFSVDEESDSPTANSETNSTTAIPRVDNMGFLRRLMDNLSQLCKKSFGTEADRFRKECLKDITKKDYLESKELDDCLSSLESLINCIQACCRLIDAFSFSFSSRLLQSAAENARRESRVIVQSYSSQIFLSILSLTGSGAKQIIDSVTLVLLQRIAKRVQLMNDELILEQARDFVNRTEEMKAKYASQLVYRHLEKLSDAAVKGSINNCSLLDEPVGKVATRLYRTMCREIVDISLRDDIWSELKSTVANFLKELANILGTNGNQKAAQELLQWRRQLSSEMSTL